MNIQKFLLFTADKKLEGVILTKLAPGLVCKEVNLVLQSKATWQSGMIMKQAG